MSTTKLSDTDYKDILRFYKIDFSAMPKRDRKTKAEHILATKLCKCIKSVKSGNGIKSGKTEKQAIAICYNSVIRKKGIKTFNFKCKKGARFLPKKGTKKIRVVKIGM